MRYVLDSNVALKWVLAEADSSQANQVRDDFVGAVHELIAPDLFQLEIAHALTRAERQGRIPVRQAALFWADIMTTPPRLLPAVALIPRAPEISSKARFGVYDCLYVALAEQQGIELVTADDKLIKTLHPVFPAILSLAQLP